ncbi:MAG: ABC transporter permease [Ruminococcus sp.]|nr:ABC transporter permease [Ruminococcus sp.]
MIYQSIKMAWKSIISNKMRSFLTMLGIIIGVVSLVVLVSIVNGATGSITDTISSLGKDMLTVTISDDKNNPLKLSEVADYMDNEDISLTAPLSQTSSTAKKDYTSDSATIYGTTNPYMSIMDLEIESGRFLLNADVQNYSYVCVVNQDTIEYLNTSLGDTIKLDGLPFTIIGILAEDDEDESSSSMFSMFSSDSDDVDMQIYIPYTTMTKLNGNSRDVTTFYATASDESSLDSAELTLTNLMMSRFNQDDDAFTINNQSEIGDTMSSVTDTLSLMLGAIAGISLVVGGIGIMNIMTVSVTERTKEIGIRKAIGANFWSIMSQFLIEAMMISLIGGLLGVFLSWAILKVASIFVTSMTFTLSVNVSILAVGFCVLIGIIFGIYPAQKAGRKPPIEALRFS